MSPKDVERVTNSVDPEQAAPVEQVVCSYFQVQCQYRLYLRPRRLYWSLSIFVMSISISESRVTPDFTRSTYSAKKCTVSSGHRLSRNICIFIVIALDETSILVAVQFSMQNIYESCDLGRTLWRSNVDVHQ